MSLVKLLDDLPDARRKQGQRYKLNHILVCAVLSILCGGRSYRDVERFIKAHLDRLKTLFGINWKRAPAHSTLQYILSNLKQPTLEWCFRQHSHELKSSNTKQDNGGKGIIAIDGKVLKGSFDHMKDKDALMLIGAYCSSSGIILGHIEAEDKGTEIPAVQTLLNGFGLKGQIYTMDALHCQKKL